MRKKFHWTRLQDTPIWECAYPHYTEVHRRYHTMDHLYDMYRRAEEWDIPYSLALDLAILCHDVIYDGRGDHEHWSVIWMYQNALQMAKGRGQPFSLDVLGKAAYYIGTTLDHQFQADDPTLVYLDLGGFTEETRFQDNQNVIEELSILYKLPENEVRAKNIGFLKILNSRLVWSMPVYERGWKLQKSHEIVNGISMVIEKAKMIH